MLTTALHLFRTLCLMAEPKITPLVKLNLSGRSFIPARNPFGCAAGFVHARPERGDDMGSGWHMTHKSAAQNSRNEPLFYGSAQAHRCLNLMESVGTLKYVYEKLNPLDLHTTNAFFCFLFFFAFLVLPPAKQEKWFNFQF